MKRIIKLTIVYDLFGDDEENETVEDIVNDIKFHIRDLTNVKVTVDTE